MSEPCANCERLAKRVAELEAEVSELKTQVKELLARLNQNSGNSHKPPSTDLLKKKGTGRPTGKNRKKRRKGRPGRWRQPLSPDKVTEFHVFRPEKCTNCGTSLGNNPPKSIAQWQQIDLPQITPIVREIAQITVGCPCCNFPNRGINTMGKSLLGPRLTSLIGMLRPKFHLSLQHAQELLVALLGEDAKFSRSTLLAAEQRVSRALAQPYQEALDAIQKSSFVWADETGWRENGKKTWLWTATNDALTVFLINPSRGKDGFTSLLGNFQGVLTTDRWCAYSSIPADRRQLCITSHLARDFQGLVDRDLGARDMATWALKEINRLKEIKDAFRSGALSLARFRKLVRPIRSRFKRLINQLRVSTDGKARALGKSLIKHWKSLWTFVQFPESLDLNNNRAERAVRQPVTWRHVCQGSKTAQGATFVHRAMTVITTIQQRGAAVWDFLQSSLSAFLLGGPAPSLLPGPSG